MINLVPLNKGYNIMKPVLVFFTCLSALTFLAVENVAIAQLNNKPFSFNTPNGSPGMSIGGKQAILNNETFGTIPDNMMRDANGTLLNITKGKGGSPIVSYEGGSVIPSFRGSSFRGDNDAWSAGVFNSFFVPRKSDSRISTQAQINTGAVISTWTGRIASNLPVSYLPSNSVDSWTGMVMQVAY